MFLGSLTTNTSRNATKMVTFDIPFIETSHVGVFAQSYSSAYLNGTVVDMLEFTQCRVILQGAPEASKSYPSAFRWLAIGRWK